MNPQRIAIASVGKVTAKRPHTVRNQGHLTHMTKTLKIPDPNSDLPVLAGGSPRAKRQNAQAMDLPAP
jgi:hypothetical protein